MNQTQRDGFTEMRRCATCHWWKLIDEGTETGRCLLISTHPELDREWDDSRATAFTHDGKVGAELVTNADFGCVEWEAPE